MTNSLIEIRFQDATVFCEEIQRAIEAGNKGGDFLEELRHRSKELAKNRIRTSFNRECETRYDNCGYEYQIWAIGLLTMSWAIEILRRKTRDGHCHTHKEKDPDKKSCPTGKQFHGQIHQDCIESFDRLLAILKQRQIDDPD